MSPVFWASVNNIHFLFKIKVIVYSVLFPCSSRVCLNYLIEVLISLCNSIRKNALFSYFPRMRKYYNSFNRFFVDWNNIPICQLQLFYLPITDYELCSEMAVPTQRLGQTYRRDEVWIYNPTLNMACTNQGNFKIQISSPRVLLLSVIEGDFIQFVLSLLFSTHSHSLPTH